MKTRFLTACAALLFGCAITVSAAWQAGLKGGTVAGTAINKTAMPAVTNAYLGPHVGATQAKPPWADYTTWVYWGQVYLGATNTWFAENIDDAVYMRIWNGATPTVLLDNTGWNVPTAGSFTAPAAGWYPVEIRMFNSGSGAGPVAASGWTTTKGFGYKIGGASSVNGADYTFPQDNGLMSLFRYDDGLGFDDALNISGTPANYGVVAPPYGVTNGLGTGDSFLCRAPTGTVAVAAGTRAGCVGYQLFTNETVLAASGATNAFAYTHALQARLVWQWEVEHAVAFTAGPGGSVSTTGGWYTAGSNVTVTATPAEHCSFYKWTGAVPSGQERTATLAFLADQPRALAANFATNLFVATSGNDTHDGLSWATALATPHQALARASDGSSIVISNGVYSLTNQLYLTAAVSIRGVSGRPEDVILQRPSAASLKYRIFNITNASASVSSLTVQGGWADGTYAYGGGVQLTGSGGTVSNCIIRNCQISGKFSRGAGVYTELKTTRAIASHCLITNNTSIRQIDSGDIGPGTGLFLNSGRAENCLVAYNRSATDSGGHIVYLVGGAMNNCTVVRNTGVGVSGINASGGAVRNCVIAGNTTTASGETYSVWGGNQAYFFNCASDAFPPNATCLAGTGLALADLANGDFHPMPGSFCIDAGAATAAPEAADLDGHGRIQGSGIDIGAYEFDPARFACGFAADTRAAFVPCAITLTATVAGVPVGDAVDYYWVVTSGGTVLTGPDAATFTTTYTTPGVYDVALYVTNTTTGQGTSARTHALVAVGAKTLFVANGNAGAAYPYDTWARAAAGIQAAVDSALAGAEIIVSNGTYLLASQILLEKPLDLHGLTGNPQDVVVRRNPSPSSLRTRILALNAGAGGRVHGLTLSDGFPNNISGGNVYIYNRGGIVSNCVIRNGFVDGKWIYGGGFAIDTANGLITHCVITNNSAKTGTDGGAMSGNAGDVRGGRLEHSLIARNFHNSGWNYAYRNTLLLTAGAIRFCTIADNTSTNVAGVNVQGGTVERCIIAGNRSARGGNRAVFGTETYVYNAATPYAESCFQTTPSRSNNFVNCISDVCTINKTCRQATVGELFADFAKGDYRHRRTSPAVDLLEPGDVSGMPLVDLDNRPRLDHHRYDLGCYEAVFIPNHTLLMLR